MFDDDDKIGVVVENAEMALSGDKSYIFDENGGFIGSDSQCSFYIKDKDNKIQDKHLKIGFEDGFFTIAPVENADAFYNESFSKMQGGFETIINKGDVVRISNILLRFVDYKEIKDEYLKHKEKLENIEKHDDIDENLLLPRGKVKFDFNEKEHIKDLIENKAHYDFIQKEDDCLDNNDSIFNYQNILKTLNNTLKDLQINQKHITLNKYNETLTISDLEEIIAGIPLIKSTKLINLLALSLICKELYSPIFETMSEDMFINYIHSSILANIKEEKNLFENLTLKALESYNNKVSK